MPDTIDALRVRTAEEAARLLRPRADLSFYQFHGLTLDGHVARQSLFPGAIFHECTIKDCDFTRSDFEGARFESCDLLRVSFEDGDVRSTSFAKCELNACNFSGSYFSNNTLTACTLTSCEFDGATLIGNEIADSFLVKLSNRVATILHTDFIRVSFNGVSLGNCTSLYNYFESCNFIDFAMNADSIGLSVGLDVEGLKSSKLVFLGREEEIAFATDVANDLIAEFDKRGWQLHAILAKLAFGRSPPLQAWSSAFAYLVAQFERNQVVKIDDVRFVLHAASRLSAKGRLPFFPVIVAHDQILRLERDAASPAMPELRLGIVDLAAKMESRYFENALDVSDISPQAAITAEFHFAQRPSTPVHLYLQHLSGELLRTASEVKLLAQREGSWIEIVEATAESVFALYAVLYLIEGCVVRLTLIRARLKHLIAPQPPPLFLQRALAPQQDAPQGLFTALASAFAAVGNKQVALPPPETGQNLQEIIIDQEPRPA